MRVVSETRTAQRCKQGWQSPNCTTREYRHRVYPRFLLWPNGLIDFISRAHFEKSNVFLISFLVASFTYLFPGGRSTRNVHEKYIASLRLAIQFIPISRKQQLSNHAMTKKKYKKLQSPSLTQWLLHPQSPIICWRPDLSSYEVLAWSRTCCSQDYVESKAALTLIYAT